jgi:hypothetical protein
MKHNRLLATFALCACVLAAQQPNTGNASMTIDANDGPTYPMNINCRTSLPAVFMMTGGTNCPFVIVASGNGNLQAGSASYWGDHYDLPLTPNYVVCIDGLANGTYQTDASGTYGFQVTCPPVGTPPTGVPLNFHAAYQAGILDYFSPNGWSLTAATRITVVQGPTITYYALGDETSQAISMASMPIPFYGTSYSQVHLCSNGYVTFGAANTDFTPTDSEMNSGPPRLAPYWTDITCPPQSVKATVDASPGPGLPGYMRVEFTNVYGSYNPGIVFNFALTMKTDGNVEIYSAPSNNPSPYDSIVGIGPGNSVGLPQVQKNFVGPQPPGSSVGPGILTTPPFAFVGAVNQSFYEWFGIIAQNAYYGNPYDNPNDIFAATIHFQPVGSGTLPGATNRYTVY